MPSLNGKHNFIARMPFAHAYKLKGEGSLKDILKFEVFVIVFPLV
jgi:hypothetical protein